MCSVEQISRPIISPCSLPITMSSKQQRTSCSLERKTSGPINPATSLTWTHGASFFPALRCASATLVLSARAKPYLRDS